MYSPVPVEAFGGMNLRDDPFEVGLGAAVDMSNADLDTRGRVRRRAGFRQVHSTTTVVSNPPMAWYRTSTGVEYIVADGIPIKVDGTGAGTSGPINGVSNNSWARFAGVICGVDGGANQIDTYDGTSWATAPLPAAFNADLVAACPFDGRLAVATGSTIYFSDPDSLTVDALNFVTLTPGDGESLRALVAWRELLFAFKQTKFFVFHGTSVDSAGGPIFNYRTVDTGHGVYGHGGAVAGDEGVYFTDRTRAYVTTGDAPGVISDVLGAAAPFSNTAQFSGAHVYFQGRFYRSGLSNVTWVFDPATGQWLKWSTPTRGMVSGPDGLDLYVVGNSTKLGIVDQTATTDDGSTISNGTAISWSYTSGLSDLGTPDRKVMREVGVWGQGVVTVQVGVDTGAVDTGSALTLATAPAISEVLQRTARRGTHFQYKLSGSASASVSTLVFRLRDQEEPK